MASLAETLARLPKPRFEDEDESPAIHQQGPRIISRPEASGLVLRKTTSVPPYGKRQGWRPIEIADYEGGGAYPEIHVHQDPLGGLPKTSNALAVRVNESGQVDHTAIARVGHSRSILHTSYKDLIPLRQRADAGEVDLSRPSAEQIEETKQRTAEALQKLVSGAVAAQKPKNVNVVSKRETSYVNYTPSNATGQGRNRVIAIKERMRDPMEPPKFKHKKIPRGPPTPPPPVMHSPPRKLTAQDQADWKIPPPISNWKNPKGFTIAHDKRLAADGRGLQDVQVNDKFAAFSEALYMADRHAREEVKQRALMQQRLAEKEKLQKEENLRQLAQQARAERSGGRRRSRSGSYSGSGSGSESDSERERREARKERMKDDERKLRQSRMGAERRAQVMAREMNRDISEKIALGLAKPTQSGEGMYDSRLFNQSSGFDSGINEDNPYDKPLFAAQEGISSIYRPRAVADDDEDGDGENEMSRITKAGRFGEALGRGTFQGAEEAERKEGPVQFEKEQADPFNVDKFLSEVEQSTSSKRSFGLKEDGRQTKKARMGEDSD